MIMTTFLSETGVNAVKLQIELLKQYVAYLTERAQKHKKRKEYYLWKVDNGHTCPLCQVCPPHSDCPVFECGSEDGACDSYIPTGEHMSFEEVGTQRHWFESALKEFEDLLSKAEVK